MIIASSDMAYLGRFLALCGLPDRSFDVPPSASSAVQFFTEYGFVESLVGGAAERFGAVITGRDTPDLVVLVNDDAPVLLAVEAKMFDRPTKADLNRQIGVQRRLLDHVASVCGVATVAHVALLPARLAAEVGVLDCPIVTWEQVADIFRDVAPPYWLAVLDYALVAYDQLASKPSGPNQDTARLGVDLVVGYRSGDMREWWMGRRGGVDTVRTDVADNTWGMRANQCRTSPLPGNPNWFPVSALVEVVKSRPPLEPVLPLGTQVRGRPAGWNSPERNVAGPSLEGISDWVTGPLDGWEVDLPEQGIRYFKHVVDGIDVDPDTLSRVTDDSVH